MDSTVDTQQPISVFAPERRRLTIGLMLTVTAVAFESLAVSTVMPKVEDDLGGLSLYGWVFSAFFLGTLIGVVLAGHAADRRGTALPYTCGVVLFAIGVTIAGAAPSMEILIGARFLQGLGAGVVPAVSYTSVGRLYPPAMRPRVFAVFSSAWIIPGLAGPSIATAIEHAFSWRFVFWGILPLIAIATAMTLPALRTDSRPDDTTPASNHIGRILVLAAGTALVLAGTEADHVIAVVGLCAVGVPVAVWAFLGLVPNGTVRLAPGLPAAAAVRGILTFAFFGVDAFVSLAVTDARDRSSLMAGVAVTAGTLGWTGAAWIQQRRILIDGPRRLVTIGMLLVAAGTGGALLLAGSAPVELSIAIWTIAGVGIGLSYSPLSVTTLGLAEPGQQGTATAALQLCDILGMALGTGFTGAIVALGENRDWSVGSSLQIAFVVTAIVAVLGSFAARRLPVKLPT
jgi:MFS family permease